jgi:hypothetical protein
MVKNEQPNYVCVIKALHMRTGVVAEENESTSRKEREAAWRRTRQQGA